MLIVVFIILFQHTTLEAFYKYCHSNDQAPSIKEVLLKMCSLYGLWSLEKHAATLYQGMIIIIILFVDFYLALFTSEELLKVLPTLLPPGHCAI